MSARSTSAGLAIGAVVFGFAACIDFDRAYRDCFDAGERCFIAELETPSDGGTDAGTDGGTDGGVDAGRSLGVACDAGTQCDSGICADSVCCDSTCAGICEACGAGGHCAPVSGPPRGDRPSCGGDGGSCEATCDGFDASSCTFPTGSCGANSCTTGTVTGLQCVTGDCTTIASACPIGLCDGATACNSVLSAAAGYAAACAILADQSLWCWGDDVSGEVGTGTAGLVPFPVQVLTNVVQAVGGHGHFCAVRSNGTVFCWGDNISGELGTGSVTPSSSSTPVQVVGVSDAIEASAGDYFTCVLLDGGTAKCFGSNSYGITGSGLTSADSSKELSPVPVCLTGQVDAGCSLLSNIVELASSDSSTFARLSDGGVYAWGFNGGGALGLGNTDFLDHPHPTFNAHLAASGQPGVHLMSGRNYQTCIILPNTTEVSCWGGQDDQGELGRPDSGTFAPQPVCADFECDPLTGVTGVAVGDAFGCALLEGGSVTCWGSGGNGELGIPSVTGELTANGATPIGANATAITAGSTAACAIVGGALECWGTYYMIGDDAGIDQSSPQFTIF